MRQADDATLVRAVQAGDLSAYTELYNRHEPAVRRLCDRWLADPVVVDDVVQAAFVRAFEHIDKCGGDSRFSGWVQVIAHRLCIDAGRAAARRRGAVARAGTVPAPVPEDPADTVLRNEQVDALQVAIAALPPRQREVVVARLVEGRRPSEIAATLGMTIAAVDSLLLRARKRLAAAYGTIVDEGGHMTLVAMTTVSAVAAPVAAAATGNSGVGRAVRGLAIAVATTLAAAAVPGADSVPKPPDPVRPAVEAPAVPATREVPVIEDGVDSWSVAQVDLTNGPFLALTGASSAVTAPVQVVLERIIGAATTGSGAGPEDAPASPPRSLPIPLPRSGPAEPAPPARLTISIPTAQTVQSMLPPRPGEPDPADDASSRPLPNAGGVREWPS